MMISILFTFTGTTVKIYLEFSENEIFVKMKVAIAIVSLFDFFFHLFDWISLRGFIRQRNHLEINRWHSPHVIRNYRCRNGMEGVECDHGSGGLVARFTRTSFYFTSQRLLCNNFVCRTYHSTHFCFALQLDLASACLRVAFDGNVRAHGFD